MMDIRSLLLSASCLLAVGMQRGQATPIAFDFAVGSVPGVVSVEPTLARSAEVLTPRFFSELGSQRVKLSYGPFYVPGAGDMPSMGMQSFTITGASKPCADDCLVTFAAADLEFEDGAKANANTGMWLHHTVFLNAGRPDSVCPKWPERFFASGNERTPADFTANGTLKTGYELKATDSVYVLTELMNTSPQPRSAVLTVEWEFIPLSSLPKPPTTLAANVPLSKQDFASRLTTLWLDVAGLCSNSEIAVPLGGDQVFGLDMVPSWTSTIDGELVFAAGHVHDGGVNVNVLQNGKLICDSVATYGGDPAFTDGGDGMAGIDDDPHAHHHHDENGNDVDGDDDHHHDDGHDDDHDDEHEEDHDHTHKVKRHGDDGPLVHISHMSGCSAMALPLKKGDVMSVRVQYDLSKHPAMASHHGGLEPIMGIGIIYAAIPAAA